MKSKRAIPAQVQPVVTLDDFLQTLKTHPWRKECPNCNQDCSPIAMVNLVYTWEICHCGVANYPHLVETIWHKECFKNKG